MDLFHQLRHEAGAYSLALTGLGMAGVRLFLFPPPWLAAWKGLSDEFSRGVCLEALSTALLAGGLLTGLLDRRRALGMSGATASALALALLLGAVLEPVLPR